MQSTTTPQTHAPQQPPAPPPATHSSRSQQDPAPQPPPQPQHPPDQTPDPPAPTQPRAPPTHQPQPLGVGERVDWRRVAECAQWSRTTPRANRAAHDQSISKLRPPGRAAVYRGDTALSRSPPASRLLGSGASRDPKRCKHKSSSVGAGAVTAAVVPEEPRCRRRSWRRGLPQSDNGGHQIRTADVARIGVILTPSGRRSDDLSRSR